MRILFTCQAIPSHYYPLEPLADAARALGHTVAFATGSQLAKAITQAGFAYFEAGTNMDDPEVVAVLEQVMSRSGPEQSQYVFKHMFGGVLSERLLPGLRAAFDSFRPELVVSETTELLGPLLAEQRALPAGLMLFGLLPGQDAESLAKLSVLSAWRAHFGLSRGNPAASVDRALQQVFASHSYQRADAAITQLTRFYRPEAGEAARVGTLPVWVTQLDPGTPLVYGTLGTVPGFNARPGALRMVIDAIAACDDVHGVVTCGRNQDPASLGPLPRNVHVERFIPQTLLLERCSAVISHGGYGTTMGALSAGVPMVLTPLGADQPEHAERCWHLGVAEILTAAEISTPALTAALQKVLRQPNYAQRARTQRAELEALPSTAHAAADLVSFATDARA